MNLRRKRFALAGLFVLLILVAAADFIRWVNGVAALEPVASPDAEAIVALTGGSGRRIEASIRLLEAGMGERLLVSGVNKTVETDTLIKAAGGSRALYACCIDIGHAATTTEGNAIETSDWAAKHGFHRIILVTSDYHMPRSVLWFRKHAPELDMIPYPMQSRIEPKNWWRSPNAFKGLVFEWAKYRLTAFLMAF